MKGLKRGLAVVLSAVVCSSVMGITAFAQSKVMGDVNGDGKLTANDVLLLRKNIAGQSVSIDSEVADVNQDGGITASDVLMMRKAIAGSAVLPDVPDTDYTVPENYPKEISAEYVFINQVGYSLGATKTAAIRYDKRNQAEDCYVVDASTDTAVFKAKTTASNTETTINTDKESRLYVSTFDFTDLDTEGTYYIATPNGRSYNFTIAKSPYDSAQDKVITALYYNRCGQALDKKIVGDALYHDACHCGELPARVLNLYDTSTKLFTYNTDYKLKAKDFAGGLHDAGDYGRYTRPGNGMVASLLVAYELFPNGVTTDVITDKSGEKISDVLDEARYEMEWMFKMQDPKSGGIYFRILNQRGWTDSIAMPDKDTNSGAFAVSRETVITSSAFAGNAAYCYTLFKDIDKDFANKCLEKGKKAYDFAEKYFGDTETGFDTVFVNSSEDDVYRGQGGAYGDAGYMAKGEMFYGAAAMYRATGDAKYKTKADQLIDDGVYLYGINGYDTRESGAVAYLMNDKNDKTRQAKVLNSLKSIADGHKSAAEKSVIGSPINTNNMNWGCNTQIADTAQNMAIVDYFTKTNEHEDAIRTIINFMFGTNGTSYSFVSGVGSKTPQKLHYRPTWCSEGNQAPDGWLVMGYCRGYWAEDGNETTCEITIYTNATFITPLASIVQIDRAKK